MNTPDPHDYETIYDYAEALPDEDGPFCKKSTLKTFKTMQMGPSRYNLMFYKINETLTDGEFAGLNKITINRFWVTDDGTIIKSDHEKDRCILENQLRIMLDNIATFENISKTTSYDEHVNTSRTEFTFTDNNTRYHVSTHSYYDPK